MWIVLGIGLEFAFKRDTDSRILIMEVDSEIVRPCEKGKDLGKMILKNGQRCVGKYCLKD